MNPSSSERAVESLEERKPSNLWNTAMFFPDYHAEQEDSTTQQFLWYFQQARTSIRICTYSFAFQELEYVLREQYKRGLIVQIVLGNKHSADRIRRLSIACGVYPRDPSLPKTDQLMHHKFAVIDDEAALTGSLNYNVDSIQNHENVCVTTNPKQVVKFKEEFHRLMSICEKANTFYY